jgi:regulator of protease activity HflC (stomatin/prohibitin superfamily)
MNSKSGWALGYSDLGYSDWDKSDCPMEAGGIMRSEKSTVKAGACAACACLGVIVLITWLAASMTVIAPATVAVVVVVGHVHPEPLLAGLHFTSPFAKLVKFDTKTILYEQANHVPTREGVTIELDVSLLFHVKPERVPEIYLTLGEKYLQVLISPELASAVRTLTSEVDASALYTSGRAQIQSKLQAEMTAQLDKRGIVVESVLLRGVVLPKLLTDAIDRKAEAEQAAVRMQYVLDKERQEAERKRIEAGGIADFQRIVSEGISPETLLWKGLEVTHEIANSPNSKVIIIGNDKSSLPVILSAEGGAAPPAHGHG